MVRERLVQLVANLAPTPVAWLAIAVGVFVHIVGFFLFRVELPGFLEYSAPESSVSFVELDASESRRDLRDQALLSDSVPLFLPSEFDYGWQQLQPETYLDSQNPRMLSVFSWDTTLLAEDILDPIDQGQSHWNPMELLAGAHWQTFRSLGEQALPEQPGLARFAMMEFRDESTRELRARFPYVNNPLEADLSNLLWPPVSVLVVVGTEGSMGMPLLDESSGITALDQFVVREARRIANLRLVPAGYYRVVLGP